MEPQQREQEMRRRLTASFSPVSLEIQDNSADHIGHGASGGHYTVRVVSEAFRGRTLVECHRMVYRALGDLMDEEIHALSVQTEPADA